MIKKVKSQKSKVTIIVFIVFSFFSFYFLNSKFYIPYVSAQTACQQDTTNPRAEGLISSRNFGASNKFGNPSKTCVIDNKANITLPQNTDSYSHFKETFYTQSKSDSKKDPSTTLPPLTGAGIYNITADLTTAGLIYDNVEVVFVDNNLNINGDIIDGPLPGDTNPNHALVFIVSGDINIDLPVRQIDAFLVSFGSIRTAGAGCFKNSVRDLPDSQRLTTRGGLVSLYSLKIIQFCRALTDTTNPAETIIHEPKYSVILQNFLSQTETITTEDTTFSYSLPHT